MVKLQHVSQALHACQAHLAPNLSTVHHYTFAWILSTVSLTQIVNLSQLQQFVRRQFTVELRPAKNHHPAKMFAHHMSSVMLPTYAAQVVIIVNFL